MTRLTRSNQVEKAVRDAALAGFTYAALDTLTAELERLAVLLPAETKTVRADLTAVHQAGKEAEEEMDFLAKRYASATWERDEARDEVERLTEQVKRARARHRGVCNGACGLDDACECEERDLICEECNEPYPCGTIRDLDGTTR